jgi:hypothetical protein
MIRLTKVLVLVFYIHSAHVCDHHNSSSGDNRRCRASRPIVALCTPSDQVAQNHPQNHHHRPQRCLLPRTSHPPRQTQCNCP